MPKFRIVDSVHRITGIKQEFSFDVIQCPRCESHISASNEEQLPSNDRQFLVNTAIFNCNCGYSVRIVEKQPFMTRAAS